MKAIYCQSARGAVLLAVLCPFRQRPSFDFLFSWALVSGGVHLRPVAPSLRGSAERRIDGLGMPRVMLGAEVRGIAAPRLIRTKVGALGKPFMPLEGCVCLALSEDGALLCNERMPLYSSHIEFSPQ